MKTKVRDKARGAVEGRPRQRFSDRIEFRRGRRDGQAGLPAASLSPLYVSGYAEGRRARIQRRRDEATSQDDHPPSRIAA